MYSDEKNVQILLSLLKAYNINNIVLSPGGSNAPIVKSFEDDSFFKCFSIVDERNSVYFGIGLSQEIKKPVVCVCTSGTAVSNFLPGMTEAFYQNVPIIAVTSDSHPYFYQQMELQKINQKEIFKDVTKQEITLPSVSSELDEWYCNRIINESLLELYNHGTGPIHINVPIIRTLGCNTKYLPISRKINRYQVNEKISHFSKSLIEKKILIICGQNLSSDDRHTKLCNKFYEKFNCVFSIETISNLFCEGSIQTYPVTETGYINDKIQLVPDIVITFGNNIASYKLKEFLRKNSNKVEHWHVAEDGKIKDPYHCLSIVFEGNFDDFIYHLTKKNEGKDNNKHEYYKEWKKVVEKVKITDVEFSSLSLAKILAETIPDNAILHTAILNSTRIMQFFATKKTIHYYSNIGALGIDGCVATFVGHSMATEKISYLLCGDLSFFYGMNGISIRGLKNNIRIILMNNGGGEEFKIKLPLPRLDKYVCARASHRKAKDWAISLGFEYYGATTNEQISDVLKRFAAPSSKPLFLEIFFDMDKDASIIRNIYKEYNVAEIQYNEESIVSSFKNRIKKLSNLWE